jgi:hypothetical protein
VITIAGSQLLVEEATPRQLALRRYELEGTDTLPPVGDSVRTVEAPAEDLAIDLGDVPDVEGAPAAARAARGPRGKLNYLAWPWARAARGARPVRAAASHRARAAARRRAGALARQLLVAVGLERVRVSRRTHAARRAQGLRAGRGEDPGARTHRVARADPPGQTTGKLQVDSGGVNAEISVDGKRIGRVPGTVDVPAGERTLTFRAARYLDHVEHVNIAGGGEQQKLKVALKPNFGVISISSVPAGAQIEVDGKPAGVTPAKVEMDSGIRRVQVSSPGCAPDLERGGQRRVPQAIGPIELGAADAQFTVRSVPAGAQVTVGGSFRGVTPITLELAPGVSHTITVARAGYAPWTREVFGEAAKQATLDARLTALLVPCVSRASPKTRRCS